MRFRAKAIKAGKDRHGNTRKFISVPPMYNDVVEIGSIVTVDIPDDIKKKQTRAPSPGPDPTLKEQG